MTRSTSSGGQSYTVPRAVEEKAHDEGICSRSRWRSPGETRRRRMAARASPEQHLQAGGRWRWRTIGGACQLRWELSL